MSYNSGLVMAPVRDGDIRQALGESSGDIGVLCTSSHINIFSKRKPTEFTGYDKPTDSALETIRYGLSAIATSVKSGLATMSLAWTYHGAQAPYFREHDFDGYYNAAPVPFMQANGSSIVIDLVGSSPAPALFYMLMASGALANKPFSTESGIGRSGNAVPAGLLGNCICVEKIGFDEGGGTYHSILGAYLGIVVFSGTTYVGEAWASVPVAISSTRDNNMFIVPTSGLQLSMGEYTAVACAKKTEDGHTFYMPVYDDGNYPTRFALVVGGVGYYNQRRVGVSDDADGFPTRLLTTTASTVYLTMRLTNNSRATLNLAVGSNAKFTLVCPVRGTVTDFQGEHSIERTITVVGIYRPTTAQTVAVGGYVDLVYQLTNIWSTDGTTQPQLIESGSLVLSPTLKYYGTDEYPLSGGPIGITYGTN